MHPFLRLVQRIGVTLVVCVAASGLSATAVAAMSQAPVPPAASPAAVGAVGVTGPRIGGAVGSRATSIVGVAWNADNSPIPAARVRLRNVVTGTVAATAVANEIGQFTFTAVEPGSYLIELVSERDKILTVGQTFTLAPGETVATFVRLGSKAPWFTGFFGNAAAAVATAAAAAGVTAIAPEAKACSSPSPGCS
jgi:Carboxypeptidase regulatory-like domain